MENPILSIKNFCVYYSDVIALKNINLEFHKNKVTAIMGPSGCGKTTLMRSVNRLHELVDHTKTTGEITLNNQEIHSLDSILLRRKVGMVFQRPNPFPTMNIYDNVIAAYKLNSIRMKKIQKDMIVEQSLIKAALWDEVKDKLYKRGTFLSGGQQQRLCIARALAMKPDILLLDEPTSALDPKASAKIESLIEELKKDVTMILVTHNIAQAARISDYTVFLYLGEVIEYGKTDKMFTSPDDKRTEEYLRGKFG